MVYSKIKQGKQQVLDSKELRMQENGLKKFRTIVSEVSSFAGNPI